LRSAWFQTSLRIRVVWSRSMLFAISFTTCHRVCKRTAWILIRLRSYFLYFAKYYFVPVATLNGILMKIGILSVYFISKLYNSMYKENTLTRIYVLHVCCLTLSVVCCIICFMVCHTVTTNLRSITPEIKGFKLSLI
jgi:hypothetical protein